MQTQEIIVFINSEGIVRTLLSNGTGWKTLILNKIKCFTKFVPVTPVTITRLDSSLGMTLRTSKIGPVLPHFLQASLCAGHFLSPWKCPSHPQLKQNELLVLTSTWRFLHFFPKKWTHPNRIFPTKETSGTSNINDWNSTYWSPG